MTNDGHLMAFVNDMIQSEASHADNFREGTDYGWNTDHMIKGLKLWATWCQPDFQEGERAEDWVQPHC